LSAKPPVAYIMSRFPRLTETFVVSEVLAVEEQGVDVRLYPLLREAADVVQPEARRLVDEALFQPFLSRAILRTNLRLLRRHPRRYLGTLAGLVRMTWRSPNFLAGGLAIFPKVAHNAVAMKRAGVGHVHCHFANHPATAGFLVHRLVGLPYSFTAHGSDLHKDRAGLSTKVAEAAFVVAISDYNRRLILEESGGRWAEKVHVIHCGVRTDLFEPRERPRPDPRRLAILCIGTLHEVKGQRYLVEACRQLVADGVDISCTLVGDGEDRSALERQVGEAGLEGSVRFVGPATQDAIRDLLDQADVLVTPSVPTASGKREGIPVVLMEAMSSGVPVVASDLSGIPELVVHDETGLLTPPRDSSAIAAAIRRLALEPELADRLARAARARVLAEFDVRRNAATLASQFVPQRAVA
jgi:glycosyltransferase involved in cell wall biosynthesis